LKTLVLSALLSVLSHVILVSGAHAIISSKKNNAVVAAPPWVLLQKSRFETENRKNKPPKLKPLQKSR
jgi:hypothetical protein